MSRAQRFLCDEMLGGLGRWLRVAGYDAVIASGGRADRELVEQASCERRVLLTCDRRMLEIRGARECAVVLTCTGIDACAAELGRRLPLDWVRDPFSRCTICNVSLEPAEHHPAKLPTDIRRNAAAVHTCPCCWRLYWEGSHVRRMRQRLSHFRRLAAAGDGTQPKRGRGEVRVC